MGSDINVSTRPPVTPTSDGVDKVAPTQAPSSAPSTGTQGGTDPSAQQAADQAKQAQEAADAARKAAAMNQPKWDMPTTTLQQDFMGVVDSIVKEGYQTAKPTESGQMGDQAQDGAASQRNMAQEMQRDQQVLREFIREANYLVGEKGMELSQMLNTIRVEQGGAFWQKVQQILQKGIPIEQAVIFQKAEKSFQEMGKNPAEMNQALKTLAGGALTQAQQEAAMRNPGKVILELLKIETNPQAQIDNFLAALKTLTRDGMQESAQKLRSYLRRRGGFTEEDLMFYTSSDRKEIFQGPLSREPIQPVNWWYLLLAIGTFGTSMGLGLNTLEAALMGIGVAVLMFCLSLIFKR